MFQGALMQVSGSKPDIICIAQITLFFSGLMAFLSLLSCGDATSIVDDVECDANADDRFNMIDNGAFRYPGQAAPAEVYFRTTVLVCLADDVGTECKTECTACAGDERERRETVKEIHQTLYYLSAGPYRFENVNKGL